MKELPKFNSFVELEWCIDNEVNRRLERYQPILDIIKQTKEKRKSTPSDWISHVTGIDEDEVNKRLDELAKLGIVRKTTTKTVGMWVIKKEKL